MTTSNSNLTWKNPEKNEAKVFDGRAMTLSRDIVVEAYFKVRGDRNKAKLGSTPPMSGSAQVFITSSAEELTESTSPVYSNQNDPEKVEGDRGMLSQVKTRLYDDFINDNTGDEHDYESVVQNAMVALTKKYVKQLAAALDMPNVCVTVKIEVNTTKDSQPVYRLEVQGSRSKEGAVSFTTEKVEKLLEG